MTVGDSEGDISMFEHSGFSVAAKPLRKTTARAATVTHRGESLLGLLDILPVGPVQ